MRKSFIWVGIVIIALAVLIFWGSGGASVKPPFEVGIIHPLDNVKGNASSSVVIMEYSDFQCPACKSYHSIMRELTTEFGDEAVFVFRHFPLVSIHPNAEFAARAAEAAGKQGKFWEMHSLLFEKQNEWSKAADPEPLFESYAALLGISAEQFKTDWRSKEVKDFVRAQRVHAVKSGLQGTPSFFVNGKQIQNPNSIETFRAIIKNAIENQ